MPSKNVTRGGGAAGSSWNLKEICELIDVLVQREITEFEMEKGGVRIRVRRGNSHAEAAASPVFPNSSPAAWGPAPPLPAPLPRPTTVELPQEAAAETPEDLHIIKSPIVGTFYAAPAPNAPPFVKTGDVVQVGQALCIIEAMKLMNEIESEVAGEVVRIYLENGQPVEYGQSLFAIKPSHKK
jgi:acetyl-CoA carboxylase biotin carboxyl carrier protein